MQFDKFFIDLSDVPIIDTIVAQQIFQQIKGLHLIGVDTPLSGVCLKSPRLLLNYGSHSLIYKTTPRWQEQSIKNSF